MIYNIVTMFDPKRDTWTAGQVVEGNPLRKVRDLLDGRWTKSSGYLDTDGAAAFWNSANGRKVFVMALPKGLPLEAAERIARAA